MLLNYIVLQLNKILPDSTTFANPEKTITKIESLSLDDIISKITEGAISLGSRILIAIIVFYIGKFAISKIYKLSQAIMAKRNVDASLASFLLSLMKIVLLFILIISVISILGIETSSFVAIFASAGVAVGLALSGTLQNFAGGVLILLLKPYRVGDYIEFNGMTGTVKEIQIFNTVINTVDNKSIFIPNGGLSTGTINNYSSELYRRVDWNIGISYGDSVDTARKVAMDILMNDPRVVKKSCVDDYNQWLKGKDAPVVEKEETEDNEQSGNGIKIRLKRSKQAIERRTNRFANTSIGSKPHIPQGDCTPKILLGALADSSVNIYIRAWTRSSNYWDLYFDINEKIYTIFPQHNLSFPFPQMDVHMDKE